MNNTVKVMDTMFDAKQVARDRRAARVAAAQIAKHKRMQNLGNQYENRG